MPFSLRECRSHARSTASRLRRRQRRADIVDRLSALSEDTGRQCGSWSVADHSHVYGSQAPLVEVGQMRSSVLLNNLVVCSASIM